MMEVWTPSEGTEITSAFRGITTPIKDILDEIHGRGWEPNITISQGQYVAKGSNPHSESLEATGPTDATAAANLLLKIMRRETARGPLSKLAQWEADWTNNLEEIAKAYAAAPVYDPKAAPAWKALADDSMRRAETIKQQIQVEVVPDPEPYNTPQEMCEDVHKNKHFFVSSANSQHPMWSVEQNVAFRIVHDVLGHCVSGGDFGWEGENRACQAHFPLLTPLAQKALFTECIAQTAAGAYFRSFMPQKVVFLEDYIDQAQQQENQPGHQGVHPSQSLVPTAMPQAEPSTPQGLPWATQIPHEDFSGGIPVFGRTAKDPNHGWESGIEPMPDSAYLWGDDPLEADAVRDTAMKVDTGWWKLDLDSQRQAITNAFRAVLLSPRKDLKWNAVHYQDIMNVPATVTDPKRYWDALEGRREHWNQSRGFAPGSHKPYWKELAEFRRYVRGTHPELHEWEADEKADVEFMHMWNENEERLAADPKNENKTADEIERMVSREIGKQLKAITRPTSPDTDYGHEQMHMTAAYRDGWRPGLYGKAYVRRTDLQPVVWSGDDPDYMDHHAEVISNHWERGSLDDNGACLLADISPEGQISYGGAYTPEGGELPVPQGAEEALRRHPDLQGIEPWKFTAAEAPGQLDLQGQEAGKYGAFMGSHLKAISQISQHVDELLEAAQQDIQEHDGAGHHFRAKVLELGIKGVGPKVASFAWLLLNPGGSQLATIDTHMMDVLGRDYTKEMNNRDYFKFERELAAGRDAAGYGHVPLGQFQWGMWDHKRTGPGSHQDHSAMKVLDPVPHDQVDWARKLPIMKDWEMPEWWQATEPARQQVAQQWDQDVATQFSTDVTPRFASTEHAINHIPGEPGRGIVTRDGVIHTWPYAYHMDHPNSGLIHHDYLNNVIGGENLPHRMDKSHELGDHSFFYTDPDSNQVAGWFDNDILPEHRPILQEAGLLPLEGEQWPTKDWVLGSKTAGSGRIPWILWGTKVWVGTSGETFMNLARRQLGYSMEDVWQRLPEDQFSAGVYDPGLQRLFPQDNIHPAQEETVLRQITQTAPVMDEHVR